MYDIDFSTPHWLITYYHVIGVISLIFDSFSIYLILFKSSKIDNFRYFLLNFQLACTLTDIHLTFFMQPVPLYPLVSGYTLGFLSMFGVTTHFCMTALMACLIYQIESMVFCFVRKHQTIAKTLKKYVMPSWLVWGIFAFFTFGICLTVILFSQTSIDPDLQMEYVRVLQPKPQPKPKTKPKPEANPKPEPEPKPKPKPNEKILKSFQSRWKYLSGFQSLPNFSIYEADAYFLVALLLTTTGGILSLLILCIVLTNIFLMLALLKTQISASNYRKHRAAIWSLLAQFATSSVLFFSPIVFVFVVLIGINGAQAIVEVLLVIGCLHSCLNVTVLILTFPPYRKHEFRKNSSDGSAFEPFCYAHPDIPLAMTPSTILLLSSSSPTSGSSSASIHLYSLWLPTIFYSLWLPTIFYSLWLPTIFYSLWLPTIFYSLWLPTIFYSLFKIKKKKRTETHLPHGDSNIPADTGALDLGVVC
nr:protein F39E9.3 [imported] - Caenorhabditis elegans [Caenorhabditis elegans]